MTTIILVISILCLIGAAVILLVDHYARRRSLERMHDMIQSAMDGTFRADTFDESLYSAVENRLAEYLNTSEISARKTAQEKERIKSLIADISHQTKTPISNLLVYTELLKEREQDSEARQYIDLLESQTQKLQFLIDSLVKMSRLETGIIALHPKEASVAELVEETCGQYLAKAKEKGLYLRSELSEDQAVNAVFDAKWTGEALGNIIDNAIKYTDEGGVTVTVKPYELFVCIEVADTGMGISEEEEAKIFGRFYRSPAVSDQAGLGIGLYLTRQILQLEGGYIKAASKEGEGARFSLYLKRDSQ